MLTAASAVALDDSRQHTHGDPQARCHVAHWNADSGGACVRRARHAHEPGVALRNLVKAWPIRSRTLIAKSRN